MRFQRLGPRDWEFELRAGRASTGHVSIFPAPDGELVDHVAIAADGRSALVTIVRSRPGQVAEAWHTTDGETWQVANGGASYVFEESNSIAVSPDGIVSQEISVALQPPEGAGGGSVTAVGDTIVPSQFGEFGDRTMWIGWVEPR